LEDLLDVRLDRPLGDDEALGDGAVGQAFGEQFEHLALASGELVQGARVAPSAEQSRDDRRIDDGLAVGESAQRVDEDRDVEHALLEQVADALGMVLAW
jgi:hypothetical protein